MPRFFQHIERPSEDSVKKKLKTNFGEVTRLKYIDDISDPDMIMYFFEDGTYCNRDFIASWDEQNPLTSGKAMIEIVNPTSIWKFKKRKVETDVEDKVATGPDGQIYHAPQPESITTDELGRPIKTDHGKPGQIFWDVERAPYRPEKFETTDDPFMLSMHPELESGGVVDESVGESAIIKNKKKSVAPVPQQPIHKKKPVAPAPVKEPVEENFTLDDDFDFDAAIENNSTLSIDSSVKSLIIPCGNGYDERVEVKDILNARKEIEKLKKEIAKLKTVSSNSVNPRARYIEDEDILIKNMIEKSKTRSCKISLKVSMELPPKELYDTIKLAYPDGMTEQFVKSLTARISLDSLFESLNGGLTRYYDGENASKKKTEEKSSTDA